MIIKNRSIPKFRCLSKAGPFLEMWRPCCWAPLAPPSWCSALAPPLSDHPAKTSVHVSDVYSGSGSGRSVINWHFESGFIVSIKVTKKLQKKVQYWKKIVFYFITGISYYRTGSGTGIYWTTYFNQWPQKCPGIRIRRSGSSSKNIYRSTTLIQINTAGFILPDLGTESQKRVARY